MTIPLFAVHFPPREVLMPALEKVLYEPAPELGYVNVGQGPRVDEYEAKLRSVLQHDNVLTVNSGTSAIHLALTILGVGPGDSILCPAETCFASVAPAVAMGCEIIWCDIDPVTGLVDPLDLERKIQVNTKCAIAVHWGGAPCDMDKLVEIQDKYGIPVIEDAAHAMGSMGIQKARFTIYSQQAIKIFNTIEGGILVCQDSEDYRRGKLLRWFGISRDTEAADLRCAESINEKGGLKFQPNDVHATIGILQLDYLKEIVTKHRVNALYYSQTLDPKIFTHKYNPRSAYWLYTILLPSKELRLMFMDWMKRAGDIMVSQVHARLDTHACVREYQKHPLPGVTEFMDRQVSIPVHWNLSKDDTKHIANTCNSFIGQVVNKQ